MPSPALPVADPVSWPQGARECERSRSGTSWSLSFVHADRVTWCSCWPARLADLRPAGHGLWFGIPERYDASRVNVRLSYDAGSAASTPREMFNYVSGQAGRLIGVTWGGVDHPEHRRAVLEAAFEILADLARADGDSIDEDVHRERVMLSLLRP